MTRINNSVSCGICSQFVDPSKGEVLIPMKDGSLKSFKAALALPCKTGKLVKHFFHPSCLITNLRKQPGEFECPTCEKPIKSIQLVKEINCSEFKAKAVYHGSIVPENKCPKGDLIKMQNKSNNLFDLIETKKGFYVGEVFCEYLDKKAYVTSV